MLVQHFTFDIEKLAQHTDTFRDSGKSATYACKAAWHV